ncbi:hypothetical protein Ae201684P_019240 [Aphanomyces euteiches]|uniref:AMP-dependent synthetase/ligase domain-containing protein n=1 Tax=Aphanomyces euteiches TaxID=100861 RepID=A0A6G0WAG0_9STRA|nr:hypothetical protein Ae201684_017046 [Aphanomyces euteiches]KAH9078142.1 hypothetical protein Ae201684P_019240 [Aphanomyces euteiches]
MHPATTPTTSRPRLPSKLAGNIWQTFQECAHVVPNAVAISVYCTEPRNNAEDSSRLLVYTWQDYATQATILAQRFQAHGLTIGDYVLFQTTRNSAACSIANMGAIGAGAVVCHWRLETHEVESIWQSDEHFKWIVTDCVDKLPFYLTLPHVSGILVLAHHEIDLSEYAGGSSSLVLFHLSTWMTETSRDVAVAGATVPLSTNCILTFQYNGQGHLEPYMLTHDNVLFTATAMATQMRIEISTSDSILAHLPLHAVTSQLIEWYLSIVVRGGPLLFVFDGAPPRSILAQCQPTLFFATPQTWQQMSVDLMALKAQTSSTWLTRWAKTRAIHNAIKLQRVVRPTKSSFGYILARRFILSRMKRKLGLLGARYCAAVLAPISLSLLQTFVAVDVPIYQWFGSAATTGLFCMSGPYMWNLGSCGKALPATQVVISDPTALLGEGHMCIEGPHLSLSVAKDAHGFWHSPFLGLLASEGFVVWNHAMDLILLSTGDWIPPAVYERLFLSKAPYLSRAIVVGEGRAFPCALFVLKLKKDKLMDEAWEKSRSLGSKATNGSEVQKCPLWAVTLDALLDVVRSSTDSSSLAIHAHPILKWRVLTEDIASDGSQLVQVDEHGQERIHRRLVEEKFARLIDAMY